MNIAQLEYFLAASRTLNYTQAAKNLFTSRQNLSHSIKELERELGVRLFEQEGGSLVLTVEGEEAARRASAVLREVDGLKAAFLAPDETSDPMRILIGANVFSFTPYDIPSILGKLPPGEYRMSELACKECYEEVLSGRADVALIVCMAREFPGCEAMLLHQDSLYLLVSEESPLAARESLVLGDLAQSRLQMPPGYEFQFEPLVRAFSRKHLPLDNIDAISSFSLVASQVRRNGSLGLANATFKDRSPAGTVAKPLSEPGTEVGLYAVYRNDTHKERAIARLIEEATASIP